MVIFKYKGNTMKKIVLTTLLSLQFASQLFAGGDIAPVEPVQEVAEYESESNFYIIFKGLMIIGDTVTHEEAVLDGDRDYGYGIDLGYRLGNGFALEYDFSYASNTVKEDDENASKATYYTSALDLVYTYEITESLGIFGKVGYEYEWEKISNFEIDSRDSGFVYGAGIEVAMTEAAKFVSEYEHSTVKGPHGDSIFAGVMFNF
jgi:opacity protein-like surface antigen